MKDCVEVWGHLWKTVAGSRTSVGEQVYCLRDGCDEIGYRIYGQTDIADRKPKTSGEAVE